MLPVDVCLDAEFDGPVLVAAAGCALAGGVEEAGEEEVDESTIETKVYPLLKLVPFWMRARDPWLSANVLCAVGQQLVALFPAEQHHRSPLQR